MENLYTHQDANVRKTWLLMGFFLAFIVGVAWIFSVAYESPIVLYVAIVWSLIMNFVSYWFSDKIVLLMTRARPAEREEFFDLYTTVENLSITAGLPMPKVYVIDDPAPNAFATGRNKDNAVVAVTTGLLAILEKSELEGVIAHELSHIGNRDMLVSAVVVVLVGFIAVLSDVFLRIGVHANGDQRGRGNAVILVIALIAAILAPIIASLIHLAISRKREFLADASGALLTRYPDGLANALRKISASPAPMRHASNATAHLFIANPFGSAGAAKFFTKLFMTHPPVEDRIVALVGASPRG